MRKFNLVKSLTKVNNITSLPFRKGLGLGRLILCLSLATFGVNEVWGAIYYGSVNAYSSPAKKGWIWVTLKGSKFDGNFTNDEHDSSSNSKRNVLAWESSADLTAQFYAKPKDGYSFKGWFDNASGTGTNYSSSTSNNCSYSCTLKATSKSESSPTNLTRYAVFTPNTYTIAFNGNGNTGGSTSAITATYDQSSTLPANGFTKTGYTFAGWKLNNTGDTYAVGTSVTNLTTTYKGTVTFYAQWTANKYNVTYDAQEGLIDGLSSKTIEETYDGKYTCPIPTRDGYDFQGWFTEQNGKGTKITTNSTVKTAGTHTLYAHWQVVNVVVYPAENKTVNFTKRTEILTTTLAFPVDNATSTSNFNKPSSSNAEWTATDYSYSNNVVTVTLSFTATENTTTRGDHTSTITLTGKNGAFATGQVTAHVAMTPVLTDNVPTGKLVGDAAIDLNTLWTSTSNGAKTYTIKTWTPDGGAHNGGAVTPAINGSTLSLGDAGKLVLQLSQVVGTSSEAKTAEHTLTINRRNNNISINGSQDNYATSCFMDGYAPINLTATNTDYAGSPITANQTAGTDIATFYPDDKVVYSTYNLGDATWTVSQPENYKYKAANATLTVSVVKEAETICNVVSSSATYWAKLGNTTDALTWTDQNAAKDLYFKATISSASVSNSIQVQQYVNGGWSDVGSKIDGKDNYPDGSKPVVTLSQAATGVRWKIAGTLGSDVTNVRVTRKTYLNASDFTINTQENNTTLVYPGDKGTGSFQVDYSLASGGDLKIACDNSKFTLDKTSQNNVDCNSGSFTVNVTYTSQTAGTDYAHVVIYNNVYRKEITITGITQKHQQTLNWKPNFDQMSLGQEVSDAASSSHGAVTYISDNPDVIRIDNGTTLVAVAKGETKITATAAGDNEYAEISIEKTISVTEKCVQYIVWTQSLMGLKLGDPNRILNAYASSEIEECTSNNGGRLVTYTSADESVVKVVNTNQLQIVGVGTTTVTAHQAGGLDSDGHDYESASRTNTVVVKDPSAKCEAFVYEQNGDAEQFFQMSTSEITGTEHTLSGEPAKITFRAKREYWNLAVNYSKGNIVLDAYTPTGGWQQVLDCGEPPIGFYQEYSKELSRDVTKIRFLRPKGGQGYHYIADAKVEMLRYIETTTPPTFQANVGEVQQQTIYLNYSNITSDILLSMASGASSHFSVDKTQITGNCGDVAKNVALTISYAPTTNTEALGEETETLIITDGTTTTNVALKGTANRVARSIVWGIDDQNTAFTVQTVNLNATAETNLQQAAGNVAYNISPSSTEGCGSINNNVLSFVKAGNVSVVATTIEDAKYLPATAVTKTWTVNLTPTEVVTAPEIDGEVVYGAKLGDIKLKANTGTAQNTINHQAVEGTFAITSGDISSAGEKTITVTFTPANTDMYASCTKDINITIQKADPNAIAQAGKIIYGATVESSELTNTGATNGTWSWTDEEKEKVLNVGTHESLKVHFTPTDKTNYNEIDGTVSLTITAVTPELTWTAKPETAQVHEVKTFTASSTNTDNAAAITYSIISGGDCATINASTGEVTMLKAGTITVQASQAATTNFNAATSITTTCTISKAPTEVTTEPQIDGDIVYGAQLGDLKLKANTGTAQNTINHQAVEGTFAITDGDISTAGQHTVTVTFTPTNTDMYASCTKDINITIQKAQPNATAQASEIIYGAAVGTSVLTNTGTTEGTWTWKEDEKEKVLPAGTHEGLQVHFTPTDQTNYNEIDGTVSLTVKKATATLTWTNAPTSADVKDKLTYTATSNHSESVITYSITAGDDCASIDANTGVLTITKAGTITVQASQAASDNYEEVIITTTTSLTGKFENIFNGNGDWKDANNWSLGAVPTEENPDVVVSGEMTISEPISVGGLTIEQSGKVNIINNGNLTVNGTSEDRETYGNLFVRNGGDVTISENANVKVFDFVVESSIGTEGQSISGQVKHSERVIYTNGAYIDINMDPSGKMDDTQWYGFTVPFLVDVQNGVARKEGDTFRKCIYGTNYMIAEYDMQQRLNTGKGWKYIQSGQLQPGHFYYFTVNGNYNTYSFKAADNTITIYNETSIVTNGEGANANWNAVGNTTLTYATISGDNVPEYVQTYVNGQSCYQVVYTANAQFVVGCPFFIQASKPTTMVLNTPSSTVGAHYAPRRGENSRPMCVRIAETDRSFSDQMYLTAAEDALDEYETGRDLAKAGVGTQSAQLWINAYGQQLCAHHATLTGDNAIYDMALYAPKNGEYELSMPYEPVDGTLYLTQDGMIIWNLNQSPYPLTLSKGTTYEYGLLFCRNQPNAPTDIESMSKEQTVDKFIYQEHLYILKNGHLYNAAGATVKQNIRK